MSSDEESEESGESEGEDGEEMWVEKKQKRDKDDNAFVGPVPDLKVQGSVAKKE